MRRSRSPGVLVFASGASMPADIEGAPYVEALEQAGLKVHRVSAGAPGHGIGYQRQALKQVL